MAAPPRSPKTDEQLSGRPQAIGIDLGTTYSAVAILDHTGTIISIPNADGDVLTPSALLIDGDEIVVGREALAAAVLEPDAYAECFKRDVGASVYRRSVCGVQVPPEVLSAFVLKQLKEDAENRFGPINQAVVTVPAFFDEGRRKATQDAGRLAGLEVLDIINEPTAAALSYGYQQGRLQQQKDAEDQPIKILVYDLGGGTFDVTILEIHGMTYRAIATDGDVQLGGKDFDERIVDFFAERFIQEHGVDPRSDPRDRAQLWQEAQRAKHTLSQRNRTSAVVFHVGRRTKIELTRDQFRQLTNDLLERTETTVTLVLQDAGLTWNDIDDVLLVGGSSRMPAVREMLRQLSGKKVAASLSPDEAIASGAAIHAAMLSSQEDELHSHCHLINVNSHSLGVRGIDRSTGRAVNATMIPRNTTLPKAATKVFATAADDQRSVRVVVLEGESHRPADCIELGQCVVRDLPAGLPKGTKVAVTYNYAASGRLAVSARVPSIRQSARVDIERAGSTDLETLDFWRERLTVSSEPEPEPRSADAKELGLVLRQLDERYFRIGSSAVKTAATAKIARAHAGAREAIHQHRYAASSLKKESARQNSAETREELVQLSGVVARCSSECERTEARARFALIVLGRECVRNGCVPDSVASTAEEVLRLREKYGL